MWVGVRSLCCFRAQARRCEMLRGAMADLLVPAERRQEGTSRDAP